MSNQASLMKARYCLSVLKTASTSSTDEARKLVDYLSTELLTDGTSEAVKIAERNALAAVLMLSERFHGRSTSSVAGEWNAATNAIAKWIDAAS